jgi:hypothetical protein
MVSFKQNSEDYIKEGKHTYYYLRSGFRSSLRHEFRVQACCRMKGMKGMDVPANAASETKREAEISRLSPDQDDVTRISGRVVARTSPPCSTAINVQYSPASMKSLTHLVSLLAFVASGVVSLPYGDQATFDIHPGFNIDLNSQRLVELEGHQRVWMSELEKVSLVSHSPHVTCALKSEKIQAKARGIKFFDVYGLLLVPMFCSNPSAVLRPKIWAI